MTTNSPNPVDGDVQALISDCQAEIEKLEKAIKNINSYVRPAYRNECLSKCQSELRRQQIALAALTAEPALWSYWFNDKTHYQEAKFGRPQIRNGKYVRETYYTTPPAQLLRPVELPQAFAYTIEGMEEYVDGWWLRKSDVIEALRHQGYEVKS